MYDEIFCQITNAANKRNLRDSTIHAYCTSIAHFLKYTDMMIFHAPIKQYTSVIAKAALTVIPCLLTVHLRYLQNTGLNVADQQGFCFQVHGLAIIL